MSRTSLLSVCATLAATALLAAGCGSHKPSVDQIAKSGDCVALAQHVAVTNAVRTRIARGAISATAVARAFKGIPRSGYLDASGVLLPFGKLSYDAKVALVDWIGKLEEQAPDGARLFEVETRAAKAAQDRCAAA